MAKSRRKRSSKPAISETPPQGGLLGILTAASSSLIVLSAFLTADSVGVLDGVAVIPTLLWLTLALVTVGCIATGRITYRFARIHLVMAIWVAAILMSTYWNLDRSNGRNSLNSMWVWISYPMIYLVVTSLFSNARSRRALVLVMFGIAAALAIDGVYESLVEMPQRRLDYFGGDQQARDQMLAEAGIDAPEGSPIRYHFESRLQDTEPLVTFALTNSLAGFLSCWFIVGIGISGNALLRSKSQAEGNTKSSDALTFAVCVLTCFVGVLMCIVLTESRSAWSAVTVGMAAIGWHLLKRYPDKRRQVILSLVGIVVVAIGIGAMSGRLDWKVITGSTQSLAFRFEYWGASTKLAADAPILGIGPGNFQDRYTLYKPPEASETIADPHNWIMQLLTSFGITGLLLAVGFIVMAFCHKRSPQREESSSGSGYVLCGGITGVVLFHVLSFFMDVSVNSATLDRVTMISIIVIVLLYMTGLQWIKNGQISAVILKLACFVLLVNLLFAGGISVPGVCCSLWVLLALLGHSLPDEALSESEEIPTQSRSLAIGTLFVCSLLMIGFYFTCWVPVRRVDGAMQQLQNERFSQKEIKAHLESMSAMDPRDESANMMLVDHLFNQLSDMPVGDVLESNVIDEFIRFVDAAVDRSPRSHQLFGRLAEYCITLHFMSRWESPDLLNKAHVLLMQEQELFPANAYAIARLSWVLAKLDQLNENSDYQEEIENLIAESLRLDALNPHMEYRLRNRAILEFTVNRNRISQLVDVGLKSEKKPKNIEQRLKALRNE